LRPRDEQENKYFYSLVESTMSSQTREGGAMGLHFGVFVIEPSKKQPKLLVCVLNYTLCHWEDQVFKDMIAECRYLVAREGTCSQCIPAFGGNRPEVMFRDLPIFCLLLQYGL